jgi:lysophospholipase L1-like esterase
MTLLKKLIGLARDTWMIVGITLLLFAATELGLTLFFYLRSFWHPPAPNPRMYADTYADPAWAARYYQEIDEVEKGRSMRWQSYVYWRRLPRQGTELNITPEGLRKTINGAAPADKPTKVFMFGGSTLWGLGAGDKDTIPSAFAREVARNRINCEVVNYGQYAYVSTQGVVELMMQLQQGNIPDVVVFYDGTNDTFGAFQLGVPGLPHDEIYREKEFGLLRRPELYTVATQSAIRNLATVRFLDGTLKRFGWRRDAIQAVSMEHAKPMADKKALARAVAQTYFNNVKLVQTLSQTYGFKCVFYWQPVLFTKPHRTEYEQRSLEMDNYPGMKEFYLDTYAALQQCAADLPKDLAFHDLSAIFRDVREPIFVDFNHMGDKGNNIIARRMADDFVHLWPVKGKPAEPNIEAKHIAQAVR